jgi:hypothetical protein
VPFIDFWGFSKEGQRRRVETTQLRQRYAAIPSNLQILILPYQITKNANCKKHARRPITTALNQQVKCKCMVNKKLCEAIKFHSLRIKQKTDMHLWQADSFWLSKWQDLTDAIYTLETRCRQGVVPIISALETIFYTDWGIFRLVWLYFLCQRSKLRGPCLMAGGFCLRQGCPTGSLRSR